jgi:transposase
MRVAATAARLASLVDRLSLHAAVEARWDMASDPRSAPWRCAPARRSRAYPLGRHHRQPVGQDDVKGGIRGYDAGKKVCGRKRHLIVDTLGLVLAVVVHAADIQDRDGAKLVLARLAHTFLRLRLIWADGGYAGALLDWVANLRPVRRLRMEIVKRTDDVKGFKVLPRRWVVERTFGWLSFQRRFSKDYEFRTDTSEALIRIAMIGLMVRRLAR